MAGFHGLTDGNAVFRGIMLVACFLAVQRSALATQFKVGGGAGWTVPADSNAYGQWAERLRFQVGDELLFSYNKGDSVLRVSKEDYNSCNTKSPMERYDDGNTVVKLDQSGPHYFISGVEENCRKNEKVVVVVLANRNGSGSGGGSGSDGSSQTPPSEQSSSPPPAAALLGVTAAVAAISGWFF